MKNIFLILLRNSFIKAAAFDSEEEEILRNLLKSVNDFPKPTSGISTGPNQSPLPGELTQDEQDRMPILFDDSVAGLFNYSSSESDEGIDFEEVIDSFENMAIEDTDCNEFNCIPRSSSNLPESSTCHQQSGIVENFASMDLEDHLHQRPNARSESDLVLLKFLDAPLNTDIDSKTFDTPADPKGIRTQDLYFKNVTDDSEDERQAIILAIEQRLKKSTEKIFKSKSASKPKRLVCGEKGYSMITDASIRKGHENKFLDARNKKKSHKISKLLN